MVSVEMPSVCDKERYVLRQFSFMSVLDASTQRAYLLVLLDLPIMPCIDCEGLPSSLRPQQIQDGVCIDPPPLPDPCRHDPPPSSTSSQRDVTVCNLNHGPELTKPNLASITFTTSPHSIIAPSPTSPHTSVFCCGGRTSNQPLSMLPSAASRTPHSSVRTRICLAVMGCSHIAVCRGCKPGVLVLAAHMAETDVGAERMETGKS